MSLMVELRHPGRPPALMSLEGKVARAYSETCTVRRHDS